MPGLTMRLYNGTKEDRAYLIPKDVSDMSQIKTIRCPPETTTSSCRIQLDVPKNILILRNLIVERDYGSIEEFVENVKAGNLEYSESERRFVKVNGDRQNAN